MNVNNFLGGLFIFVIALAAWAVILAPIYMRGVPGP